MVEDRETLWRGRDVNANLLPHTSIPSCEHYIEMVAVHQYQIPTHEV